MIHFIHRRAAHLPIGISSRFRRPFRCLPSQSTVNAIGLALLLFATDRLPSKWTRHPLQLLSGRTRSRVLSTEPLLNSAIGYRKSPGQNSHPKRVDITSMSRTPVPGVSPFSFSGKRPKELNCQPAHRTLIVRKLKGLEDIIPYTAVHWEMLEKGTPSSLSLPL